MQRTRFIIFLKDVFLLAITAVGGPHAHIPLFIKKLVNERRYITEEEFVELNALCQILPGPTSTQTITAIGYKIGKAELAYLTLLVWALPSLILMTSAAIVVTYFTNNQIDMPFIKFVPAMAVAFVAYAAWAISSKVVSTNIGIFLMIISSVVGFFFRSPYVTPLILLAGGLATTYKYNQFPKEEKEEKLDVFWANFILFVGVFVATFILGLLVDYKPVKMGIKLFESFYRNGSLIFGGGQVLIPLLHTEYVELKKYVTSSEFLTGYALVQAVPGPVFSFSSYLGAISMKEYGIAGQIIGSLLSTAGIFLPGAFLIFFVYRIWGGLKKYRFIKASLEGINAVSSGLVIGVAVFLFQSVEISIANCIIMGITFIALLSQKVPSHIIVPLGLLAGWLIS
ncbi:MAG: chromate efflux transporter [Bacteroidota bacterium]|nr:chromate efflux transporter [Bacteroidota bacterium]